MPVTPPDEPAGPPSTVDARLDLDAIEADLDAIEAHLAQLDDPPAASGPERA